MSIQTNEVKRRSRVMSYSGDQVNRDKLIRHFELIKKNFAEQCNSLIKPHPKYDYLTIDLLEGDVVKKGLCEKPAGGRAENYFWRWDWSVEYLNYRYVSELDMAMVKAGKSSPEHLRKVYADYIEELEFTLFYPKYVTPAFFNRRLLASLPSYYVSEPGALLKNIFKATPLSITQFEKAAIARNIPFEQFTIDQIPPGNNLPDFDQYLTVNFMDNEK